MRIIESTAGGKSPVVCLSCLRNRHKLCDLHINDDAFDAEDFVAVRCNCFCKGQIGTVYDSLLDMAKKIAEERDEASKQARNMKMLAARAACVADDVMEAIRKFDNQARDDEGNFLNIARHYRILDEFFGVIKALANRGDAVLEAIVENNEFASRETLSRILERNPHDGPEGIDGHIDPEIDRDGHIRQCPADCEIDHDSDEPPAFDGPIGDGPQGAPSIEMMKQHRRAQAARDGKAEADVGWPVD